ncbi:hypothetical protein ABT187_42140 [Streptomyces sp. NPDC001817]|uniref:hypothetical protein n=1 Tax=Streptomyces sp. NPDC001817 TaxID=3154398 RepID=UPI0033195C16
MEALDLTAERLRHLQDAFTKAAETSRARADRYAEQNVPTQGTRRARTAGRPSARSSPDRTATGRSATERIRCCSAHRCRRLAAVARANRDMNVFKVWAV